MEAAVRFLTGIGPVPGTILVIILGYPLIRYIKLSWFSARIQIGQEKGLLITGATSGIGLLLSKHFHSLGFTIFATYYNDQEPGYAELGGLRDSGRMFLVKMDVRSRESIRLARQQVDEIMEERGVELFCLINNAGLARGTPFEWEDRNSIKDLMDTNLIGMMWVTREFLLRIVECQGRVVNVSSGLGVLPMDGLCAYGSSKSAAVYFSEALQLDLDRYGARSCCVLPGNLTDKSNIIFEAVRGMEVAKKGLSERELARYKESIRSRYKTMRAIIERRMRAGEEQEWRHFFRTNDINSLFPANEIDLETRDKTGCFRRLLISIMNKVSGGTKKFEEILLGFEQVICLQNPPSRVYPGNTIYTHLIGPLMELIPPLLRELIGRVSSIYLWQKM